MKLTAGRGLVLFFLSSVDGQTGIGGILGFCRGVVEVIDRLG
jgi:hypothetical protein